eukprot:GHVH01006542.1.p1 GENE.GHVH01006542.1~~GHVH01006542.1.p1  ORF type:complete len:292 (+),score=30.54 GHVH01006542.1:34-909(+)
MSLRKRENHDGVNRSSKDEKSNEKSFNQQRRWLRNGFLVTLIAAVLGAYAIVTRRDHLFKEYCYQPEAWADRTILRNDIPIVDRQFAFGTRVMPKRLVTGSINLVIESLYKFGMLTPSSNLYIFVDSGDHHCDDESLYNSTPVSPLMDVLLAVEDQSQRACLESVFMPIIGPSLEKVYSPDGSPLVHIVEMPESSRKNLILDEAQPYLNGDNHNSKNRVHETLLTIDFIRVMTQLQELRNADVYFWMEDDAEIIRNFDDVISVGLRKGYDYFSLQTPYDNITYDYGFTLAA